MLGAVTWILPLFCQVVLQHLPFGICLNDTCNLVGWYSIPSCVTMLVCMRFVMKPICFLVDLLGKLSARCHPG